MTLDKKGVNYFGLMPLLPSLVVFNIADELGFKSNIIFYWYVRHLRLPKIVNGLKLCSKSKH